MKCYKILVLLSGIAILCVSQFAVADITQVSVNELDALMAQGVTVIDVRREDEWRQTGVIPGSRLNTFFDKHGKYDVQSWMSEIGQYVNRNESIALICHSGYRSTVISQWLSKDFGYSKIYNVSSGIYAWKSAGKKLTAPALAD